MSHAEHIPRRLKSQQYEHLERVRMGFQHQVERFGEDGFPDVFYPWVDAQLSELRRLQANVLTEIGALWQDTPVAVWVGASRGLGPATYFVLGLLPPLSEFASPAKMWRYCGLHPEGGQRAVKGEASGYNRRLKAYAIHRLATPCMKHIASPYRSVYDYRRAATVVSHPAAEPGCVFCTRANDKTRQHHADHAYTRERKAASFECASVGGPHWSDGHRHADALRVTAKAVLLRLSRDRQAAVVAQRRFGCVAGQSWIGASG